MEVFSSPSSPAEDLSGISEKLARLETAFVEGKRFLVLPIRDPQDSIEWIIAAFKSPLAVVPINPSLPKAEYLRVLSQLPENEWIELETLPMASAERHLEKKSIDDIWAVIFSSGSSGIPKGVALSGRALQESAAAHLAHNGFHDWLLNLPLHHIGGFSVVSRAYILGSRIAITQSRFDATETLEWLRSKKVSGISLVPTTLRRLMRQSREPADYSALKIALIGGAPVSEVTLAEARLAGIPVRQTYGLTENASQAATETSDASGMKPLPGVEVRIAEDGEILLRSPFLAKGVYRDGILQPLPLTDGFYPTGDLGHLEGTVLTLEGRKSEVIISGGVKIFPAELEHLISELPGIEDAAVVSLPDAEWGEIVCMALVGLSASPDTVKSYLAERLDSRKLPKAWVTLTSIPRSSAGKVLRADLQRILKEKLGR